MQRTTRRVGWARIADREALAAGANLDLRPWRIRALTLAVMVAALTGVIAGPASAASLEGTSALGADDQFTVAAHQTRHRVPTRHTRHHLPRFGPCHVRGSKLLFHDARVEVVRGPSLFIPEAEGHSPAEAMWKVYSCVPGGKGHFLLSIGWVDRRIVESIDHVTLAGVFGAFHVVASSIDTFDHVEIFNLATGHRVAQNVASTTYDHTLTALVLDEAGTAAWTESSTIDPVTNNRKPEGQPPGPLAALWGASTTHAAAILDTGMIDPASVTVSAATVSWTNAGVARQRNLGGP
jgi:hypothetical protein